VSSYKPHNRSSNSSITCLVTLLLSQVSLAQPFVNGTADSGINHSYVIASDSPTEAAQIAAGGAVADYDQDGDVDIYLLGGHQNYNRLYKNRGNGSFEKVNAAAALYNVMGSGPLFVDVDGDAKLDILTMSINRWEQAISDDPDQLDNRPRRLINNDNDSFSEAPQLSGFVTGMPSFNVAAGDLDRDGDLDLFISHWVSDDDGFQYFWENDGTGTFSDVTAQYLGSQLATLNRFSFTPNITDINNDGWPDILLASDFGASQIFISNGVQDNQLTFTSTLPPALTDENGMGASVGDYDNDGDMDWFVTSVWDPNGVSEGNWGVTGNRLYRNDGNGNFEDVTDVAGVRIGYWGWGSCFADFNNDGHLDIYHETGFSIPVASEFHNDPSRLFMSNGDGTFTESALANGLDFTGQGRGVSCFDHDLDGDLDILVMPNNDAVRLYRNELDNNNHYLNIVLRDSGSNPFAIGARIIITTATAQQIREVTAGSNFVSNNPLQQHIGLGDSTVVSRLQVNWPNGDHQVFNNVTEIDRQLMISRYCYTQRLTIMPFTASAGQHAMLRVHAAQPDGNPLINTAVNLLVTDGPNTSFSTVMTTNDNGIASFSLNRTEGGLDRISYSFSADGAPRECQALVRWNAEQDLYADGFESPIQ